MPNQAKLDVPCALKAMEEKIGNAVVHRHCSATITIFPIPSSSVPSLGFSQELCVSGAAQTASTSSSPRMQSFCIIKSAVVKKKK